MKITTIQEDFIYNMLQALEKQFEDVLGTLKNMNSLSEENFDKITARLGKMVIDGTVEDDYLKLTPQQQKEHFREIQKEIGETFKKEYELQKQIIQDELLTQSMNYQAYKEITLKGSFSLKPMDDMGDFLKIVNKKVNGLDWSERLWKSKQNTVTELNRAIKDLGKGYGTIGDIKKRVRQTQNAGRYAVNRLVRNELCRVQSEVNERFDKENDIEYQLFMATLDNRTSDICKELDGKVFRTDDPKKPIPPNGTHIQCRSTLVSIPSKDWRPKNRRDRRGGKNEIIPYETWKKENMIKVEKGEVIFNTNKSIMEMSYEELEEKAKELNIQFGGAADTGKPVDIETDVLRYAIDTVSKLQTEFPVLKEHKLRLTQKKLGVGTLGQCWSNGQIDLNLNYYKKNTEYVQKLAQERVKEAAWHSKTSNALNSTFTHEYGHFVSTILMKLEEQIDWDKIVKEFRAEVKKEYKKLTGETVNIRDTYKVLSKYGASSPHETFAEAFQEAFNCDSPRPYAQAFKKVLERKLKR